MTKFIERKNKPQPVLSVLTLGLPVSQKVLSPCNLPSLSIEAKMKALSRRTFPQINILPGAGFENNLIRSEFPPYCPECDQTYKREQVMTFREHCRVMHDWLWCENWHRGEGCELATTSYDELQEHLVSCDFKLSDLVAAM